MAIDVGGLRRMSLDVKTAPGIPPFYSFFFLFHLDMGSVLLFILSSALLAFYTTFFAALLADFFFHKDHFLKLKGRETEKGRENNNTMEGVVKKCGGPRMAEQCGADGTNLNCINFWLRAHSLLAASFFFPFTSVWP